MSAGLYFVLKYFSFPFTAHLPYSDNHLWRHNLFGPVDNVITDFAYTCRQTNTKGMFFRLLWPCIMNVGWRERNQQDANNLMFIIKLLPQYVSGITPYAAVHTLVLLMMGIMMSETCWDKSLIINIRLVASSWFLSLHSTFMMHGHTSLKNVES